MEIVKIGASILLVLSGLFVGYLFGCLILGEELFGVNEGSYFIVTLGGGSCLFVLALIIYGVYKSLFKQ